jgi:hypothetical protein
MNENRNIQKSRISNAFSPDEIAEYWDSHSLADHWDETHEVEFEMRAQRLRWTTLDAEKDHQ